MNGADPNLPVKDITWLPQRYRFEKLHSQIDANYFATVAFDKTTGSRVLIELIPVSQFDNDGLFRLEYYFGYASRLKIESYVAPIEWGYVREKGVGKEHVYMVRPDVESATLEELLDGYKTPAGRDAWNRCVPTAIESQNLWMRAFLASLEQLHQVGITQQDFRLSHVLIDDGRPRLVCPGLRLFSKPECRGESWSLSFGKSASPELLGLIEQDVNGRSDVYSAGVVLYCLLNAELPFDGSKLSHILSAHLTKEIEADCNDDSRPLMKIAQRMLEKNPRDRYQSVKSVIDDLDWLNANDSVQQLGEFVAGRADFRDSISVSMFVGRQEERAELRDFIDCVRDGASRVVLIKGESGLGKTRLVSETLREASNLGIQVFQSKATEQVSEQPIAPLTKLIDELAKSDPCATLAAQLQDDCEDIHFFFPAFANAIGLNEPARRTSDSVNDSFGEPVESEGDQRTDLFELNRLSRTVCSVLSKISSPHKPAIIWIDDCQWLDVSTVETLRDLNHWQTHSLLIILTARTSRNQSDTSHISIELDAEIETGPLSDSNVCELVSSMAVGLPQRALDTVVRLASGSPFMAEAILREMVETEALNFKNSMWLIDSNKLNEIQASSDATEALLHRLEQFPPRVLAHLSIAAIIGKSFFTSTVAAISGTSTPESQRHLNWARQKRIIWSRPDGSHSFVHDSIRIAMVERLSDNQKKALHTSLAEHFETNDGDNIEIAIHFDQAGLSERALEPALNAAQRAQNTSSLSTALQMYQIAWKCIPGDQLVRRSQVAESIGSLLMLTAKYIESDQWFARAEDEAESKIDRARIMMQRGELAFKKGQKQDAVSIVEDAMKSLNIAIPKSWLMIHLLVLWEIFVQVLHSLAPSRFLHRKGKPSELDRMKWRMYSRLAHCYWYTRGKAVVLWAHLAGLNRAETATPTRELAQAWSEHAPVMGLVPWYGRGSQYSTRSLNLRNQLRDVWGKGQTRSYFSILLHATSRYEHCIAQAMQAEKILQRTGDYWEVNIARYQRAASLYRLGNLKEALELAKTTYEDAINIGDHQSSGNILDVLVRASLGNIPIEYIEQEKIRDLNDLQLQPQLLCAEGIYYLRHKKDASTAIGCFERAIKIARKAGVLNCYTAPNAAWLATALRQNIINERKNGTVSADSFRRHYLAAKRAVRIGLRFKNDLPHALRELGIALADLGKQKQARKTLVRSLKLAQSQNARYESALTQQAFERLDARFGWREVSEDSNAGNHEVREIEASVRLGGPRETVSIANRFDALLDAGRKISSALGEPEIFKHTVESATELLRGQTSLIVLPVTGKENTWQTRNSEEPFDKDIVLQAVAARESIIRDQESLIVRSQPRAQTASVLCCPIIAGGKVVACIYIANRLIESMFGANEIRIAEFIGNAAGSSLEKETIFRELDELNACLEEKVYDRTKSLQTQTRELEQTAQQLRATQHRLEDAAQSAESANRIKSEFLAKMSHEIRTPITAVLGFTQLILRGVVSEPEEQRKKMKSIESSGKHLLQLVNDLLDISKIEADKVEIEKIECRPLHLLSETVESLRSKARENNNKLVLELIAPLPETIQSDPKRLRQVVTNVLGNAIKFTSDGDVTLRVSFEQSKQGILKMEVIDSGIGMTPEQLKNIFDPFAQADSSITRRFGGTGLGLSISQTLTKALGGDIDVVSQLGEGSTFSISIDAGDLEQLNLLGDEELNSRLERRVTSDWITADLTGLRILLADDAETNRDLISLVLGACGADITLAENGQEAVDRAINDEKFDIVLMDMQMPILDGYSATRKLRSAGFDTPIFALTANSMKGDREKCMNAGCSDYLTKPIDLNSLVSAMAKIAGSEISLAAYEDNECEETTIKTENKGGTLDATCPHRLDFSESDLPNAGPIRNFSFNFLDTLDRRRTEFESCLKARDGKQLASLAHWLKGTSGTVMLKELAASALEMEDAIRADDWEAVMQIYKLIEIYSENASEFSRSQPVQVEFEGSSQVI